MRSRIATCGNTDKTAWWQLKTQWHKESHYVFHITTYNVYMYLCVCIYIYNVKVKQFHSQPGQAWGFQEAEAPRFLDSRHVKVVRLSALRSGRLYPQKIFLVFISVRGWVDPTATVWPEGLFQWKIPMTPSGIEPATFRVVAQCLNKLRHRLPPYIYIHIPA